MAVKQSASFVTVEDRDLRPGKTIRMADLESVAGAQAHNYELITNNAVPNAVSAAVSGHDHSSNVLPFPLASASPQVRLHPQSAGTGTEGWGPCVLTPFRVPAGITKVVWIGLTSTLYTRDYLRVQTLDSTLAENSEAVVPELTGETIPGLGWHVLRAELDVSAAEVNVLQVECWDGYNDPDSAGVVPGGRDLIHCFVYPEVWERSGPAQPWVPPAVASTKVKVPGSTQHLGASAFTSKETGFFTAKRSVNSWLVQGLALNDSLNFELLHGAPAGGLANNHSNNTRYKGHTHGGESALTNCGALTGLSLCTRSYGVARPYAAASGHLATDLLDSSEYSWIGHIHAPSIIGGSANTQFYFAWHSLRIPALHADHALDTSGGATTKLKAALLVRLDTSKATQATYYAQLRSLDRVSTGTEVSQNTTTNGLRLLTFDDLDCSADPGDDGLLQTILFSFEQNAASFPATCCYGSTVWLEP